MMIKINHDRDLCQLYAQCTYEAPKAFWLDENGELQHVDEVGEDQRDAVEAAADVCPMRAISLEESS